MQTISTISLRKKKTKQIGVVLLAIEAQLLAKTTHINMIMTCLRSRSDPACAGNLEEDCVLCKKVGPEEDS